MRELCGIFVWCRFQQNIFEKGVYKPVYKAYNKRTEGIVFFCLDENGARMAFEPAGPPRHLLEEKYGKSNGIY